MEIDNNNDFWNYIWTDDKSSLFRSDIESTYLRKVPNGWLMRHLFAYKKEFTSSAIIFLPDSNPEQQMSEFKISWEPVTIKSTPNIKILLHRAKTPKGWVMKEITSTKSSQYEKGSMSLGLAYMPDQNHAWVI